MTTLLPAWRLHGKGLAPPLPSTMPFVGVGEVRSICATGSRVAQRAPPCRRGHAASMNGSMEAARGGEGRAGGAMVAAAAGEERKEREDEANQARATGWNRWTAG